MLRRNAVLLLNVQKCIQTRFVSNTVGFIGLGNMGARMVNNFLKKGRKLKVYDVSPAAAQALQGVQVCQSPKEAADDCSIVITMLPNGGIVRDTVTGENGILKSISKDALLVDCSTIDPAVAQELSQISRKIGVRFLDAPVSGGVTGAAAATLTFMVGGPAEDCKAVEADLLQIGARVVHCGGPGLGQVAKICNNLILGATMVATSEALNLGQKLGLNAETLTSIINTSTGRSWSSETYNPVPGLMKNVPSADDYKGGFSTALIAKDLALAENCATSCNLSVPLTAATHQLYRAMISYGYGQKDFSAVYQFLKGIN